MEDFVSKKYSDLGQLGLIHQSGFRSASPYQHIYFDNFFDNDFLKQVLDEFPDMSKEERYKIDNPRQKKFATQGTQSFGISTSTLLNFLNGDVFLGFLQTLSGINEPLISDSTFLGGGLHETKGDGLLKIHTDFAKHRVSNLDRRLNVLVFLNKDWNEEYGGALELWDSDMSACKMKILPTFNRIAIFETTNKSYHGHPDPLTCPEDITRKSMALYYYSDGRPKEQRDSWNSKKPTTFFARPENQTDLNAMEDYSLWGRVVNKVKRTLGIDKKV